MKTEIRFPTDGTAKIVEITVIEDLGMYGLNGNIEHVISHLQDLLKEGQELGLTNIRLESDYRDEPIYGGDTVESERFWYTEVKGDNG